MTEWIVFPVALFPSVCLQAVVEIDLNVQMVFWIESGNCNTSETTKKKLFKMGKNARQSKQLCQLWEELKSSFWCLVQQKNKSFLELQ